MLEAIAGFEGNFFHILAVYLIQIITVLKNKLISRNLIEERKLCSIAKRLLGKSTSTTRCLLVKLQNLHVEFIK